MKLEKKFIQWPNEAEKKIIEQTMDNKLPKCIGYVDGSHINLNEAPVYDPESYYTRKQRYALQIQAICDNDYLIRNIFVGFPGSVHDARVFANSDIGTNPDKYLNNGQWIAGDSAYPNSEYIVTPFRLNSTTGTPQERRKFNKHFSSFRVAIECCFGILKQVFSSLQSLRIRIDSKESHKLACDWIVCCCILYNIIRGSLSIEDFDLGDEENGDDNNERDEEEGNKRTEIFNFVKNM